MTGTPRARRSRARTGTAEGSTDRYDSPPDRFGVEHGREDALGGTSGEQHPCVEHGCCGRSFDVHHIELRVTLMHRNHLRHEKTRVRKCDIVRQGEHRCDRRRLLAMLEQRERSRELTGASDDRGATRAVVPVGRGRETRPRKTDLLADEASYQEPIVDQRPTGRQGPGRSTPRPQPHSARRGRACPGARPELSQCHQEVRAPRRRGRRRRSHHRPRCPTDAEELPAGSPGLDATPSPS